MDDETILTAAKALDPDAFKTWKYEEVHPNMFPPGDREILVQAKTERQNLAIRLATEQY